jgi:hypothetical protein
MVSDTPSSVPPVPELTRVGGTELTRLDADPDRCVDGADERSRRAELQDLAVVHDGDPVAQVSASSL